MLRSVDILVVDDRVVDADAMLLALRRAAPRAKTLRLKCGDEALRYLFAVGEFAHRSQRMPGLMLVDMELPMLSGLCLLDLIRAHPLTSSIPVVMLRSAGRARLFRRHDRFGADAYLVKPLVLARYCALMEKVVRRWLLSTVRASVDYPLHDAR